jgi:DNA-binding LytR/AlgR family response regulator
MNSNPAPTAVVAEDEATLADELREMLTTLWPELRILAVASTGGEALDALVEHQPDIAFLDIRMPGLSGVEVARQLLASGASTRVVFVTAYDAHAIEAFDARAVDYVLKPVRRARLAETVDRLKRALAQAAQPAPAPAEPAAMTVDAGLMAALQQLSAGVARKHLRWINCSQGSTIDVVAVSEVLLFQSRDKYTGVITADKAYDIRVPIKELIDTLDPEEFWQVHRSSIVRAAAIERFTRDELGRMQLKLKGNPAWVPVSQPFAWRFRQM